MPGPGPARDLLEERVLSALDDAFARSEAKRGERDARRAERHEARQHARTRRGADGSPASGPSASVTDEIERLRSLRDAGALTDEQYARAVDRVLAEG